MPPTPAHRSHAPRPSESSMAAKKSGGRANRGTRVLGGWQVTSTSGTAAGIRRGGRREAGGAVTFPFVQRLLTTHIVKFVESLEAEPAAVAAVVRRGDEETPPLTLGTTSVDDIVEIAR